MHTYMHTYILRYILTLHRITIQYNTIQYNTSQYITIHAIKYNTLHYICENLPPANSGNAWDPFGVAWEIAFPGPFWMHLGSVCCSIFLEQVRFWIRLGIVWGRSWAPGPSPLLFPELGVGSRPPPPQPRERIPRRIPKRKQTKHFFEEKCVLDPFGDPPRVSAYISVVYPHIYMHVLKAHKHCGAWGFLFYVEDRRAIQR